jgi:hypothetical protein
MNIGALSGNIAWLTASAGEWLRFRSCAGNLERSQRLRLQHYLRGNAKTEFGRKHGFANIRSWEEYADKVPARSFDELRPWIDRIAAGEQGILTENRVRLFEPSSGSTGPEKWVPYTASLQAEFRRAVAVWVTATFLAHPSLMAGRAYWSLTPAISRTSRRESVVPVGFDTDSEYLGGAMQALINLTLVTRPQLGQITDMEMFWRLTLLLLLKCRDLRMISVWHPTYLSLLLQQLCRNWDGLLQDLRQGLTIRHPELRISSDISRARELSKMEPGAPAEIWPRLGLISCWTDAHASGYLHEIKAAFPDACLQPKGLVATEAFVTIPLGGLRPLAIRSHFFEFFDDDGRIRAPWQLKSGQTCTLVVTTGGGLYRYRLEDRVEVNGFFGQIPSLRFLGKNDNVSDYFGEKLSESFAANALKEAFLTHGLQPGFAMLAIDDLDNRPAYKLYLDCRGDIPATLAEKLDVELRKNPHYDLCLRLGQLEGACIVPVSGDAFDRYTRRLAGRGIRLGDIKPTALSRLSNWRKFLLDEGEQ